MGRSFRGGVGRRSAPTCRKRPPAGSGCQRSEVASARSERPVPGGTPWHDGGMTDEAERVRPDRRRIRALVGARARAGRPASCSTTSTGGSATPAGCVDIGTGTGQLALGALGRWPQRLDGRGGRVGRRCPPRAELRGRPGARGVPTVTGSDPRSPSPTSCRSPTRRSTSRCSSFVLQLVPKRGRALRETRRVLRPGGLLSYVSWLQDDRVFEPDRILDDVLDEVGIERTRGGWTVSATCRRSNGPRRELRRAGFADVTSRAGRLEHPFTVDGYVAFLTEFDEETLFAELDPNVRERVLVTLRRRLGRLSRRPAGDAHADRLRDGPAVALSRCRVGPGQPSSDSDELRSTRPPRRPRPARPRRSRPRPRPGPPRRAEPGPWRRSRRRRSSASRRPG